MSVPTRVLQNGQWVTRWLDPYQLLAQNRAQEKSMARTIPEPEKAPCNAVLSQTLMRSPIWRSIRPARIRHQTKNDVVFIGEDSIHLKEAHRDYSLSSVVVKPDFEASIRVSGVFGLSRKPIKPLINPLDVNDEPNDQESQGLGQIKIEQEKYEHIFEDDGDEKDSMHEEESGMNDVKPPRSTVGIFSCGKTEYPDQRCLPPQMLVLVLENAKLAFVYAISGPSDCVRLVTSQSPLPFSPSRLHQIGEHLAIDPKSRALAIGAQENVFYIYALKSRDALRRELRGNSQIMPIKSERAFTVDGMILHMDFLHPAQADSEYVILLLVILKRGKSKLIWYEWHVNTPLNKAHENGSSYSLPSEDRFPLLLIPLLAFNAFAIVGRSHISIYKEPLTGTPEVFSHHLTQFDEVAEVADFKNPPLWVQWARPVRSPTEKVDENIYLCREDGVVHYIDVKYKRRSMIESSHNAGRLGMTTNGSFAVIDVGPKNDDLLVAGSDSSAEGIWKLSARKAAEDLSIRPSWAPLNDCIFTLCTFRLPHMPTQNLARETGDYGHLFACTGTASVGFLSELRCSVQNSTSMDLIDLNGVIDSTILDTFVLCALEGTTLILISHPISSSLLRIRESGEPELLEDLDGFVLDSKSIIAKSVAQGVICQVTQKSTALFTMQSETEAKIHWSHDFDNINEEVIAASVEAEEGICYIAVALRRSERYILSIKITDAAHEHQSEEVELSTRPTCLAMYIAANTTILVVGNDHGGLQAFGTLGSASAGTFQPLDEWSFQHSFEVCDSIAIARAREHDNGHERALVVCGLRNGQIHSFALQEDTSKLVPLEEIAVGHTSITVKVTPFDLDTTVISCCNTLYTINWSQCLARVSCTHLRRVHLDASSLPGTQQNDMFAFALADALPRWKHAKTGTVAALGPNFLRFLRLISTDANPVAVQWRLRGTPVASLYSEQLGRVVALSQDTTVLRGPQFSALRRIPGKRTSEPLVTFINVHATALPRATEGNPSDSVQFGEDATQTEVLHSQTINNRPGERFLGMIEWFPEVDGKEYHLLVFNTTIKAREKTATGRLVICAVTGTHNSTPQLTTKTSLNTSTAVYTVAPYLSQSSLIFSTATDLVVVGLDKGSGGIKFNEQCKISLRSPARCITVQETYVYLSTAENSLQVYRYHNSQLSHWRGDTVARPGVNHVNLAKKGLTLASDRNGGVFGLWQPSVRQADNALVTVFEATLPRTVTSLMPVHRPSWTRDMLLPDGSIILQSDAVDNKPEDADSTNTLPPLAIADSRSEALIGTGVDGTLTQFQILDRGWQLLKFIQNLSERNPSVCLFKSSKLRRLEPAATNPRCMHINGDVLKRLLFQRPQIVLKAMLDEPCPLNQHEEDYPHIESVEERWRRFRELVAEMFGEEDSANSSDEEIVRTVSRWMTFLLRPAI